MHHDHCLKRTGRSRKVNKLLLLGVIFLLISCGDTNSDVAMPTGNPLDFEPIPQLGVQTQSNNLTAWQPKIYVYRSEGFDAGLDTVFHVDVLGTGLGSRFSASNQAMVTVPDPDSVVKLYAQVVFKAGSLSNPVNEFIAPEEIVVSTPVESKSLSAGQLNLVPLTDDAGLVVNNTGRVYETELQPASQVSVDIRGIRKFGTLYTPRALIVYVFREVTDYQNGTMSTGRIVNRYLHGHSGFEQASQYVRIQTLPKGSDLEVTFTLAELGSDPRHVTLVVEAGSGPRFQSIRREVTLERPTDGDEFSQYTFTLNNVPIIVGQVTATVISPRAQPGESVWDNGDSVFWHAINVTTDYERNCGGVDYYNPITTQTKIDALTPCTDMTRAYIGPESSIDPISNLEGLRNVRQAFEIYIRGTSIKNLEGIDNITMPESGFNGAVLTIEDNPQLESLEGFISQPRFEGTITIANNASLTTLEGTETLRRVVDTISSLNKPLEGRLRIVDNPSLRTLEGLESLEVASQLDIENNAVLEHITDLRSLIDASANINDNPALDCSLEPQPSFLPVDTSSGNLVDCLVR